MKRILVLCILFCMLFLALPVLADCLEGVEEVEENCTDQTYVCYSLLADNYELAAECFSEEGDQAKAEEYFNLAGDYYVKTADELTISFGTKAALYNSAGDSYHQAGSWDSAEESYSQVLAVAEEHPSKVLSKEINHAEKRINQIQSPESQKFQEPEVPEREYQVVLWGLLLAAIVGIALLILHERR